LTTIALSGSFAIGESTRVKMAFLEERHANDRKDAFRDGFQLAGCDFLNFRGANHQTPSLCLGTRAEVRALDKV
jgi:hypothetical protein